MRNKPGILIAILTMSLFAGDHLLARQTPPNAEATVPCNDQAGTEKKKEVVEHDPLADPTEELKIRAQKRLDDKNFKELQDAAAELAVVSEKMNQEISKSGQFVV